MPAMAGIQLRQCRRLQGFRLQFVQLVAQPGLAFADVAARQQGFAFVVQRLPAVRGVAHRDEQRGIRRDRTDGQGIYEPRFLEHLRRITDDVFFLPGVDRSRVSSLFTPGVRYIEAVQSDVFTFTLQKSESDYSPTTMYRDYLISERLVHWESQNTTSLASPTGQRYINHRTRGTHVLLFARRTEKTEVGTSPFLFLGPASIVRHSGERPIAIVWELDVPAPAEFVADAQILAG